jgi:octaheme c-type cytochrome (tetrathionate reductase family)
VTIASNEGRCSQCHISYGWQDNTFDFTDTSNIDCLICHDTTGTYKKHPSANGGGGPPAMMVDGALTVVEFSSLQDVANNVGEPTRANCLACHAFAGGGDNVKHGDLSTDLIDPTSEMDVHMGGRDFSCQTCHETSSHKIAGTTAFHTYEGETACSDCHDAQRPHAANGLVSSVLNIHTERVSCQACHIPAISRTMATTVAWYWDEAGEDRTDIPEQFGRATYDKKKGRFEWDQNVEPTLLWYDGNWERAVVNANDTYTVAGTEADPVVLAKPTATINTENAKLYPFKALIGRQPVDTTNKRLMVPHLFGTKGGPNPYWGKFDWGLAIADGAAYAGQPYSGNYGFANTLMYLKVDHEVAPATMARSCEECHGVSGFFEALGYEEDPFGG